MRKKNDILLKGAFEETFPDLLRFFFKDAETCFDLERGFEFLDKELLELFPEVGRNGGSRFVDMLAKVFESGGTERWLLIHIEIQERSEPSFGKRMFQYFYRIFDRYDVPISAVAIFTGSLSEKHCTSYGYDFLGTSVRYQFNTFRIFDFSEEELFQMDNPFALIIAAVQKAFLSADISEQEMGDYRFTIARALVLSKRYDLEKIRRILFFLKQFLYVESFEINRIFDQQIEELTQSDITMGIIEAIKLITREEGIEKGVETSKRLFVTNLLVDTDFSLDKIAQLADASEELVWEIAIELNITNR